MGTTASSAATAFEFSTCCDGRNTANSLDDSADNIDDASNSSSRRSIGLSKKSLQPDRITPAHVDFEDCNPASYGPGFAPRRLSVFQWEVIRG